MALNFTELNFDESGSLLYVNRVSGGQLAVTTKIDFQEQGVLFEVVDIANGNTMVFVPYANIADITQHE